MFIAVSNGLLSYLGKIASYINFVAVSMPIHRSITPNKTTAVILSIRLFTAFLSFKSITTFSLVYNFNKSVN